MVYDVTAKDEQYTTDVLARTDAGTYCVWYKVVGDGGHETEPASVTVTIGRADISKAEVTLKRTSYVCDGTAKEPVVKGVVLDGRRLAADTDYAVSYKGNAKPDTATAIVYEYGRKSYMAGSNEYELR